MATGRRLRWAGAAAVGWLALIVRPACADPPKLFGETPRTAQRFAEAAELEKRQRWTDAVEVYLRLVDEAGDDLVPADSDANHLLPARGLVHRRIAARPELLAPYRARVEGRAKRLQDQGEALRDPQLLEQVVDQFFCSRSANAALHLLGDLACERGEFDQARHYWRLLEPADSPRGLAYPDPQGGPELARAKQILARLLAGEKAAADVEAFRKSRPAAVGHLAGRDGNLAVTLQTLLDTAETVRVPAAIGIAPAPTTFAGDASRNGVLHGMLPPFSPEPKYPAIPLPGASNSHRLIQLPPIRPEALAFFPVIARGQVFVADARRVLAYDLATGQESGRFVGPGDGGDEKLTLTAGGFFTLTVDGDRIYAHFGPPRVKAASELVCLQWRPDQPTPEERLRLQWMLPAVKSDAEASAAWEGTPIVRDGRLFAAVTRLDGARAVTAIVCYPAADPTAGPIWRKDVYEAPADSADRHRPHLLTLAGNAVVLCSDAGAIVALEAVTGRRAWAFRYPAGDRAWPPEPNPCVAAAGRLIVVPADADRVWCLDAATGTPIWASEPVHVAHLLGVVRSRVVCTLGGFHPGLCSLDAVTGRRLPDWGYRSAGTDALAPFGRGLLCGDRVYWPTRAAGLNELRWDGTTGYPPTAFRDLPGGNLAYGDGCLVVATADRLHVLIGDATDVAGPGHRVGLRPQQERHELLLWRAELLGQNGYPAADVRAMFDAASGTEFPPDRRVLALVRRAEFEGTAVDQESDDRAGILLRDADGRFQSGRRLNESAAAAAGSVAHTSELAKVLTQHPAAHAAGSPTPEPRRLRFPLEPAWQVPLDRGREWALFPECGSEPGRVYVGGHHWLACREVSDGAERWRADLSFTPTWLAAVHDSLIVAGDNGAVRLNAADGRLSWQFHVPDVAPWFDRPGWRDPNAVAPAERIGDFRWAGDRLVARLGSRSLIGLDGATGQLLWQRIAPFGCEFRSNYFADGRCAVAQSTDGRRWVLDAATGHVLHTGPAPTDPWPNPPLALDEHRLLVAECGRLVALDRTTWTPNWIWELPRGLSLTGEQPQTRLVNGVLLVGVPRNDCYEIERLDPATGWPLSEDAVAVGREPVDLGALAFDRDSIHVATGSTVKSIDCRTGRVIAQRPLKQTARWRVDPAADGLLIWSVPIASPKEPPCEGAVYLWDRSEPERQRGTLTSLALGLGPGNALRSVRVIGNEVVVVSDAEIRGFRRANREVK